MGPITLFDKSFLQSLNVDEAVWFDHFFYPVIAPVFIAETLGDLYKQSNDEKSPEEKVSLLAVKTPQMSGGPSTLHTTLWTGDLLGHAVPMSGQIPIAGMRRVRHEGKEGAILEVPPEVKALNEWQRGRFSVVDHQFGRAWRESIERTDLTIIERTMKLFGVNATNCRSLEQAVALAGTATYGLTKTPERFRAALALLQVPAQASYRAVERWKRSSKPPLAVFAPYAAFVIRLELFFRIALGANLVASTRPSHRIDISYLFYLPFCNVFVSGDKLHRACAPLFLREDQEFVWAPELKTDLRDINLHFHELDEATKCKGIYKFAKRLPEQSNGIVRALYQRHTPHLLLPAVEVDLEEADQAANKKLVEHLRGWEKAEQVPDDGTNTDALDSLIIQRFVNRKRGAWFQVGPEVPDEPSMEGV